MDRMVLSFRSPFHAMEYLGDAGESAAHIVRRGFVPRETMLATAAMYDTLYRKNNLLPCTFEIFNAIGWSPSPDQPKPLDRGSQKMSLASISTGAHKELQEALAEAAKNPNNREAQLRAEELFQKMQADLLEDQHKLGMMSTEELKARQQAQQHKSSRPSPNQE